MSCLMHLKYLCVFVILIFFFFLREATSLKTPVILQENCLICKAEKIAVDVGKLLVIQIEMIQVCAAISCHLSNEVH